MSEGIGRNCLNCGGRLRPLAEDMRDWEYGVSWESILVMCSQCGLVTHEPPIVASQIESLYPSGYLAHTSASRSTSIYGRLKGALARRSARSVASRIPSEGACLEVGCGNGSFLRVLGGVRPDLELAGVDISDVNISGIDRFTFYKGQLEEVDFGGRRFDLIYFSNLIEHVPDPFLFLKKCASLLTEDGVIFGVTPDHRSLDRYIFKRYWAGYHYPRHTFVFDHRNLGPLLAKAGFDPVSIRGSYSFWYLSLANRFLDLPGTKKRGIGFAMVTGAFLPIDLAINIFRCHGSMTFVASRTSS